jgi:hypothetical protein
MQNMSTGVDIFQIEQYFREKAFIYSRLEIVRGGMEGK